MKPCQCARPRVADLVVVEVKPCKTCEFGEDVGAFIANPVASKN
jgi:hypothetical protein